VGGPYRSSYLRTRNVLKIALPLCLVIGAAALVLIHGGSGGNDQSTRPASAVGSSLPSDSGAAAAAAAEPDAAPPLDGETQAVIAEIQRQIEQDRQKRNPRDENPTDPQMTATTDGSEEKSNKAQKESGPDYVDLFNDCRYSFTVKYQLLGGVDLYVLDSYTGEMRIKTNFTQDKPLALFDPDDKPGKRRFVESVAQQLKGGADVFVFDSFTGEVRFRSGVADRSSLRLFENSEGEGYFRYSAQVLQNSGKFDFFVTDLSGGETRIRRGLEGGDSLSLFAENDRKDRGKPRYVAWVELNSGNIDFYILDTVSGELRIREKIGDEKSLSLFEGVDSQGPVRFAAWVNYNAGAREIFAQDRFTGELKLFPAVQGKRELRLFDLPVVDLAWPRYQSWPDYVLDRYWIYTFDSATSELTSDSHDSFQKPYAFPASRKYVPPMGRRYDGQLIRQIDGVGVILYVIDTYTSEVRVAKGIAGKGKVSLF
jgi:hypothetical protein